MSERHGAAGRGRKTPEYIAWMNMRRRTLPNARPHEVASYWDRGIRVCDRWQDDFQAFLADVGPRPSAAFSLDRIDNDRGYEPNNVRWERLENQANNKTNNIRVDYRGERMTLHQAMARAGCKLKYMTVRRRLLVAGWTVEAAIETPLIAAPASQ